MGWFNRIVEAQLEPLSEAQVHEEEVKAIEDSTITELADKETEGMTKQQAMAYLGVMMEQTVNYGGDSTYNFIDNHDYSEADLDKIQELSDRYRLRINTDEVRHSEPELMPEPEPVDDAPYDETPHITDREDDGNEEMDSADPATLTRHDVVEYDTDKARDAFRRAETEDRIGINPDEDEEEAVAQITAFKESMDAPALSTAREGNMDEGAAATDMGIDLAWPIAGGAGGAVLGLVLSSFSNQTGAQAGGALLGGIAGAAAGFVYSSMQKEAMREEF